MTTSDDDWSVSLRAQPRPEDYGYDLDRALRAVVSLRVRVPDDAFTAQTLGTERSGSAVLIDGAGLLLTMAYLVTEAEEIWLTDADGRVVPGDVLGYDNESGLALVQALGRLDLPPLVLGDPRVARAGTQAVLASAGGRNRAVAARVVARQEFAGYWEYLLEDAMFTAPAHPHWGGAALIGPAGELLGIGSLQLAHDMGDERAVPLNMVVPVDLLAPVLEELRTLGRPARPARPWLGLFAADDGEGGIAVAGLAGNGPAKRAGLRQGDTILAVDGQAPTGLADFFRRIWALGEAGVEVPLTVEREGDRFGLGINSGDRRSFLKAARLH